MDNNTNDFNDEARRLIEEKESQLEQPQEETPKKSLGKVQMYEDTPTTVIEDIGWIRVKLETLPSQGIFYPEGTEITIRAAAAAEIRHWSTIDEDDLLSLDDALNRIADKCCKIRFPRQMGSFKDLKEIDRFFIVFAIREFTFKKGENNLTVAFDCKNCGKKDNTQIIKEMLSYYTPADELQPRFSYEERCFHLRLKNGDEIKLYLPTLGVMAFIKGYIREKAQNKEEYDKAFLRWAPFLFADWRVLNTATYHQLLQDSYAWSLDKISIVDWFVGQMQKTVNANLKHECTGCGSEVEAPLNFRGGVKSLFLVSDISSKLL